MDPVTKRSFIFISTLGFIGFLTAGFSRAAKLTGSLRLRPMGQKNSRPGLSRRLARINIQDIDEAFKLANRRVEIEVTR